ncbi:nucleoside hydrolase [Paenibacillus filicis]|uniref:Nucleoside hydrolase n=1 Tax=Paenibacillus gyeongsangnamensis TaxID=3388067 RepID=A0ABT4QF47_9BACL|nr:nucleoside hydrolase [Paenibacillus filicis]MCZ8515480.1 nucleoside hydrolase [Paenibacillus filicis]
MPFPKCPQEQLIRRLNPPEGKVRIVLDTDTYNEIDDQFAVVYALQSKAKIQVEGFYAAPFFNSLSSSPKDGMEKSYLELEKILSIMGRNDDIPIYKGSESYLIDAHTPVESEAARNLVERAMASGEDDPLYVVAIGAITNVASALLMEPRIVDKIVVLWLGGHALHWPNTKEFNLAQDLHASRIILDSGVPLILVPCMGVSSHLQTTLSEIRDYVKEKGGIGEYLYTTFKDCHNDHFGYSRVIWDISTIAFLNNAAWLPSSLVHSPILSEDFRWSFDSSRHFIRYVNHIHRDEIFKDLFGKLS